MDKYRVNGIKKYYKQLVSSDPILTSFASKADYFVQ